MKIGDNYYLNGCMCEVVDIEHPYIIVRILGSGLERKVYADELEEV